MSHCHSHPFLFSFGDSTVQHLTRSSHFEAVAITLSSNCYIRMERDDNSPYRRPQLFSKEELMSFTSDLKKSIGFGGFGKVYEGEFSDGVKIAVKVLKENTKDVVANQFLAEVSTMGSISHPNIIKLYGYCFDTDMKALVYEYMKFGSLDKILFENHIDIEWEKLYDIAIGIANGLSFLHEECRPRIIHYDIKPANVLIDSNLSPKIMDFGMARHSSQVEQSGYRGTNSYAAPEVGKGQPVTYKSDVYSFGMMLFEILRKKKNSVGPGWFPGEVGLKVENDELKDIVLVCDIEEKNREKAEKMSFVALWCTQKNYLERPDLSTVVKMLKGEVPLGKPPNPFLFYDDSPESSMFGGRPLPKYRPPQITEGLPEETSPERASRPPSKSTPIDLKTESAKTASDSTLPEHNALLEKERNEHSSPDALPEFFAATKASQLPQPLINRQEAPAGTRDQSWNRNVDWSTRMRERYGLDQIESNQQEEALPGVPAQERRICTIM